MECLSGRDAEPLECPFKDLRCWFLNPFDGRDGDGFKSVDQFELLQDLRQTPVPVGDHRKPDTTLHWSRVPGAAGYRVYWRLTTDAQWRWSRPVGDVTSHTLRNTVIDNYFFGVASVGADGLESPVVFPGPLGAFR